MKYFSIEELCKTSKPVQNIPNQAQKEAMYVLIMDILDPLREWYGKPIIVNSGFRNPEVNKLVGGSKTSQHMKGEAADITAGSPVENKKLYEYIKDNLDYDQLIDESNFAWVHVSYKSSGNRRQLLKL